MLGDTRVTARYRSERHEFRTPWEAMAQAIRLAVVTDAFLAQVCYRAEVACRVRRIPVLPLLLHKVSVVTGQISIGPKVIVEPGVYLPHGQVVIDGITCVRSGVVIRPFVTMGLVDGNPYGPNVGARSRIGTGAKVVGPVRLGPDVQVGANAVVVADVPAGTTVVGVPARPRPGRAPDGADAT